MHRRLTIFVTMFAALTGSIAFATSVEASLWQQWAEDADFIGVVECSAEGGIVAGSRVVEVWKGDVPAGALISVRVQTAPLAQTEPVGLVGERFLVTAYRDRSVVRSTSGGLAAAGPPSVSQNMAGNFRLPLFQGLVSLTDGSTEFRAVGSTRTRLDEVRKDFQRYLALSAEERALELVRTLGSKYLEQASADGKPMPELSAGISDASSHEDAVRAIVANWDRASDWGIQFGLAKVVRRAAAITRRQVAQLARSEKDCTYVVQRGDTLNGISRRFFGTASKGGDILEGNRDRVTSPERLMAGVVLRINWRQALLNACEEQDGR